MNKLNIKNMIKYNNEFDDFLVNYDKAVPIILYGFGGGIIGIPEIFKENEIEILAVCDRDKSKQGKKICDIDVISFEDAIIRFDVFNVYITVSNHFDEIRDFLRCYISVDRIFGFGRKKNMTSSEYRNFLSRNEYRLNTILNSLSDNISLKTMKNVILGSITNNLCYFEEIYAPDQYFPKGIVDLSNEEIFVDAGAYNGDSIKKFLEKTDNHFKKIYAFEPDAENAKYIEIMGKSINRKEDIVVFTKALYDKEQNLSFDNDVSRGSHITDDINNENIIGAVRLDELIEDKVTFIKMDIEGCELRALKGAENSIKKYRPKLAICIYHKYEDILEIPEYLMSLNLNYRFYMRHHTMSVDETVFYAV